MKEGDMVSNPYTGDSHLIKEVYWRKTRSLIEIKVEDERSIRVTFDHPLVTQKGPVAAGKVTTDDALLLSEGQWGQVISATTIELDDDLDVVNFRVDGFDQWDDFLVSADGVVAGTLNLQNLLFEESRLTSLEQEGSDFQTCE